MTASAAAAAPLAPKRSSRHLASSSSSAVRGRAVGAGAGRQRLSAAPSSSSGSDGKHRRGALQVSAAGLPPDLAGMMGNMDPAKLKEIQEQYAKAMKDPATAKKVNEQMAQMQGMMNNPMVAKQMQAMNNMIANPDMQKRIADLKDDPDFENFFQDVQKNGPGAMMKYSNDTSFLKKLNDKLGGEDAIRAAVGGDIPVAPTAPAEPAAPAPEVETLHDAARYGDVEAVEDFIAVGKDVNARDSSQRTPLHYAIAFGKGDAGEEIFNALISADSDLTAVDEKKNTPLHYACGYGKTFAVKVLLDKGCSVTSTNGTGKTPLDLVKLEAKNPINDQADLLAKLAP